MQIRLNKFLAQAGVASRREVDKMIAEGRIKVNGQVVQVLGYKIDDEKDRVDVEGRRVEKEEELIYLMINKPPGYLVTLKDNFQRPTIQQLFPSLRKRVFPVGRLDYDSSGLLLLTNDGELAYRLTHPRFKVPKVYLVKVKGEPVPSELTRLEKGIYLDDKKTAPAKIVQIEGDPKKSLLKVEIYEGRKREVKRMFQVIGHKVIQLQRINFGGLGLGSLKMGKWRFLTRKEIDSLKKQVAPK
ncbi:Ribosomal large subunit pseudouridine synthase B [subsurface metagenome]